MQEEVEHLPEVSDNSDGDSDSVDGRSFSYDEDSHHNISVEISLEVNQRLLDQVVEDTNYVNNEIIGDSE